MSEGLKHVSKYFSEVKSLAQSQPCPEGKKCLQNFSSEKAAWKDFEFQKLNAKEVCLIIRILA